MVLKSSKIAKVKYGLDYFDFLQQLSHLLIRNISRNIFQEAKKKG